MQTDPDLYSQILVTHDLSIGYPGQKKKFHYLQKNINLKLYKGELVCLLGPNGSGKSTLIRTLGGLQKPVTGDIQIHGVSLKDLSYSERSLQMSTVLTDRSVIENITVFDIIAIGRYQHVNWLGQLTEKDTGIIKKVIRQVGMSGYEYRHYSTLSDGEKQRVFIAKALASDAPVMLLDEPTAHLDIPNRVEIMTILRRLTHETGHSVLISTHELDLALQLSDEVWLMIPGDKILVGTPEEVQYSGLPDRIFGNEAIRFSADTGTFRIQIKNKGMVCIEGSDPETQITAKALERMGYSVVKADRSELRIITGKKKWCVVDNQKEFHFTSLTDLCRYIRNKYNR